MKHLFFHTDPQQVLRDAGVDLNQPVGAVVDAGAPAPGTGQPDPTPTPDPPAGAQNTDTGQGTGGPPESVPYPRFKEVNDQLRSFKELEGLGYDADSLRQLAQWGVEFDQNPVDSWLSVAEGLDDLPEPVRVAVKAHLEAQGTTVQPQQQPNGEGEQEPAYVKELRERLDERDARDAQTARENLLASLVDRWKKADAADGIKSIPDERIYTYISGNARAAKDEDELFTMARGEFLETREHILGGSVVKPGDSGVPVTVPGSGAPVQEAPPRPRTLAEASAQVEADLKGSGINFEGINRRS